MQNQHQFTPLELIAIIVSTILIAIGFYWVTRDLLTLLLVLTGISWIRLGVALWKFLFSH
jgi:hypothetical protein